MAMRANTGKFDNALDEAVYGLSLDGGPDEEVGSSSEAPGTWAGIMRDGSALAKALKDDAKAYPNVTSEDRVYLSINGAAGVILLEDSNGFVKVRYYAHVRDLDKDWAEVVQDLSVDDGDFESNRAKGGRGRGRRLRSNSTIAERRARGEIEGLTKDEIATMELRIPDWGGEWRQIGGDMDPGKYGGTIATADGNAIEIIKIQPVREHVGDDEAKDVGFPFWSREGYYNLDDLSLAKEDVQSAIEFTGLGEHLVDLTPEQRAVAIAEAMVDAGAQADEGEAGWAADVIGSRIVKWMSGQTAGSEYIADEDAEFRREVLGERYEVVVDGSHESWFEDEDEAIEEAKDFEGHVQVKDSFDGEVVWDSKESEDDGEHTPNATLDRKKIERAKRMVQHLARHARRPGIRSTRAIAEEIAQQEHLTRVERGVLLSSIHAEDRGLVENPSRERPELETSGVLDELLKMQAETNDPSGRGRVPREIEDKLVVTDELRRAALEYEKALEWALAEVVMRYPPADGATSAELFSDSAPYLVLMTLRGEGVGIWDGSWDAHYDSETVDKVADLLKRKLGMYADDTGSGKIAAQLDEAVFAAADEAGYTTDDSGYVRVDEHEENRRPKGGSHSPNPGGHLYAIDFVLGHQTHTLVVRAEDRDDAYDAARKRLRELRLVTASLQGSARVASQADLDREFKPNPSGTHVRWHVFLNGELLEPVYMDSGLTKDDVKQKLLDAGYDPRIVVDQPPERRTNMPPHYRRGEMSANRKWSRAYVNRLPDSAFLYVESGGQRDKEGKTVPRRLRHFPYKDLAGNVNVPHVKDALGRIPQSNVSDAAKREATSKARRIYEEHGGYQ